ncbi:PRD domain-containing protein [Bacillus gobiensis]|uniref:BglG family transcription antiterminator n=1 Tax=Bacillus gobiensis TaxID=1441095 RepID=UPI003D20C803
MNRTLFISGRQAIILKVLIEAHAPVPLKEIADRLQVSLRTVQRELAQLKSVFKNYNLKLVKKLRSGVLLSGQEEDKNILMAELEKNTAWKEFTPKERQIGLLFDLLQLKEPAKLYTFSKKYKVTEATISHDLNEAEAWLEHYQLKLVRKPGLGVYIQGNEKQIRKAMAGIIHEYTLTESWLEVFQLLKVDHTNEQKLHQYIPEIYFDFLDVNKLSKIYRLLHRILHKEEQLSLTERDFINLIIHLALAIERNELIPIHKTDRREVKENYPIVYQLVNELEREFMIQFPFNEIEYMILHIYGSKVTLSKPDYSEETVSHFVRLFISVTESVLGTNFSDEILVEGLIKHLYPALNRLRNGLEIHNPLLAQIKKDYCEIFKACEKASKILSEKIGHPIPESEVGYLALHIGASFYSNQTDTAGVKAVVVCASGFGTSRFIASHLQKNIPVIEIIDIVSFSELDLWLTKDRKVDLIISTIQLDHSIKDQVHLVSPILTERELNELHEKVLQIVQNKQNRPKQAIRKEMNQLMVSASYGEGVMQILRHFDVSFTEDTGSSPFHTIARLFQQISVVQDPEKVVQQLERREKQGSFIIEGIAVVHTRTEAVTEMLAHILRLRTSLDWLGDDGCKHHVQTILIMAGPKSAPKEHFSLLGEISARLTDPTFIHQLHMEESEQLKSRIKRILLEAYQQKISAAYRKTQ